MDILRNIFHALSTVSPVLPYIAMVAAAIAIVAAFYRLSWGLYISVMRAPRDHHRRDSTRLFSEQQKTAAARRCGNRCEGTGIFRRCSSRSRKLQGDHWFPHSKGGATTEDNLVMLCGKCNRRKSDKIPTPIQTWALKYRRQKGMGYPHPIEGELGRWLPRRYVWSEPRKDYTWTF